MKTQLAFIAVLLPTLAGATGDRIVVLAASGAPGVRAQLAETLCLSEECVAPEAVLSAGKLDWGKVSKEHVVAVVTSHAVPSKAGAQLDFSVLAPGGKAKLSEKAPLNDANKLSVKELVTASAKALSAIDSAMPAIAKASSGKAKASAKMVAHRGSLKATHRVAARTHVPPHRG